MSTAWDAALALVNEACAIDERKERVATLLAGIETDIETFGADDTLLSARVATLARIAELDQRLDQIDREIENIWVEETQDA